MAHLTATISGPIRRPDGTPLPLKVTVQAVAISGTVKYTDTGEVIAGQAPATYDEDTGLLVLGPIPQLPQTAVSPPEARWRAKFELLKRRPGSTELPPPVIEFTLTGDTTWGDIIDVSGVPVTDTLMAYMETVRTETLTARDEAIEAKVAAEGVGAIVDTQIASRVNDRASATAIALSTAIDERTHAQTYDGEEVDVFLIYGQSNARGYAGNTPGDPAYKTPNVTVWNGTAEVALTNYMPTALDGNSTGGAWVAFANEYARRTGRTAIIVNAAKGSQSIAQLSKGDAAGNYAALQDWALDVKAHIAASGRTVGKTVVLFCQGEADSLVVPDATSTRTNYTAKLAQLWTDIKADIGADLFAIYTIGQYNDGRKMWAELVKSAQRKFARTTTDAIVAFDDMESMNASGMKVDGVHLNQAGYNYMGEKSVAPIVGTLFTDSAYQQPPLIDRLGRINLDGSQEWKMYGGWFVGPTFVPQVTTNRASHGVVSTAVVGDHIEFTLADRIDYIHTSRADILAIGNSVRVGASAHLRAEVDRISYQNVDADGKTVVKVYLVADLSVRLIASTSKVDTAIWGKDLGSDAASPLITVVKNGVGDFTITHPATTALAVGSLRGATARGISVDGGGSTTRVRTWDAAGAAVDSDATIRLFTILIPPANLTGATELMWSILATERVNW